MTDLKYQYVADEINLKRDGEITWDKIAHQIIYLCISMCTIIMIRIMIMCIIIMMDLLIMLIYWKKHSDEINTIVENNRWAFSAPDRYSCFMTPECRNIDACEKLVDTSNKFDLPRCKHTPPKRSLSLISIVRITMSLRKYARSYLVFLSSCCGRHEGHSQNKITSALQII